MTSALCAGISSCFLSRVGFRNYHVFFVSCLLRLNQDADAAELMLQRAILLIPVNEDLAFDQFKAAKSIIAEYGPAEKRGHFEKAFGSTLLRYGKTDLGMEVMSETEQKTSIEALGIADTYLSSSEDRLKVAC